MYKVPSLTRMLEFFFEKKHSQLYSLDHQWCFWSGPSNPKDPPASTDSRCEVKVAVLRFTRNLDSQFLNFAILLCLELHFKCKIIDPDDMYERTLLRYGKKLTNNDFNKFSNLPLHLCC